MAPLSCPLCCKETFSSHRSLKFHILDLIDSLLCPSCGMRFQKLLDLAEHLDAQCGNFLQSNKEFEQNTLTQGTGSDDHFVEMPREPVNIKQELEEVLETNGGAENGEPTEEQPSQDEIQEDPDVLYTCEMCDITFSSVQEHLAKYHEGEEVLLETEEREETAESQEDENFAFDDQTDDDMFDEEGGNSIDSTERTGNTKTVSEQNKIDQEGNQLEAEIIPVTTKYIFEDGKVRKISEEEAAEISDNSKIIEIHCCLNCNLQFPNMTHFKKHNCSNVKKVGSKRAERAERKNEMHKVILLGRKHIKEEFRYQCTFCLSIYTSLIGLNDHMKSHLVQDDTGMVEKKTITMSLHVCEICNTKFPTYKQLRLHSRMHEPVKAKEVDPPVSYNMMGQHNEENTEASDSEREKFECTICKKLYDKKYEEVHMKFHDEQEQFICLVCNRKFDSKGNLDMHTKAHSNTKKFACSYCKKSFNSYATLEDHVLNQCQKRDFECQYCGRRFGRPHEKVKHERIHTGEKPHVCEICGKSFRVAYCLTLHMRTHTGNRPYTCHHCGKRFKSHSVFNHHMKTHSEDRNYKCTFCPKAFKTAVQLAGHKNSHTKPFSCTECNRPFASLYSVKAHMDTHKRDNNLRYKCWICGASYARSFALRDHMNEAHGKAPATEESQDEQALMELEGLSDQNQLENTDIRNSTDEPLEENQEHQMVTEDGQYQVTGTEDEMCQVQILSEGVEGDGYVHIEAAESNVHIQEQQMEVVET